MTAAQSTPRPAKPEGSPLYPHPGGQWTKKIRCQKSGKQRTIYCGPWDDHDAALRYWLSAKDQLLAGIDPTDPAELTIADMCNLFMDSKAAKRDCGSLTPRSFANYHAACERLIEHFGKARKVVMLRPADFAGYRQSFPTTWGPRTQKNCITDTRCIFGWAYGEDHIDRPIKFGEVFAVTKNELRADRAKKPAKLFTAAEIRRLIDTATNPQMKAIILLGINGGFGGKEASQLRLDEVQSTWLDTIRGKTTEPRRMWLWQETRAAIAAAIEVRPTPKPGYEDRVFLTFFGVPWVDEVDNRDAVGQMFYDLKKTAKCDRSGLGFYGLRHTFQTEAEELANDPAAIKRIMGHADASIQGAYRERISDHRLKKVCTAVRGWLFK